MKIAIFHGQLKLYVFIVDKYGFRHRITYTHTLQIVLLLSFFLYLTSYRNNSFETEKREREREPSQQFQRTALARMDANKIFTKVLVSSLTFFLSSILILLNAYALAGNNKLLCCKICWQHMRESSNSTMTKIY